MWFSFLFQKYAEHKEKCSATQYPLSPVLTVASQIICIMLFSSLTLCSVVNHNFSLESMEDADTRGIWMWVSRYWPELGEKLFLSLFSQIQYLAGNAMGCLERPHKVEKQKERHFQSNPLARSPCKIESLNTSLCSWDGGWVFLVKMWVHWPSCTVLLLLRTLFLELFCTE